MKKKVIYKACNWKWNLLAIIAVILIFFVVFNFGYNIGFYNGWFHGVALGKLIPNLP
jgi:hypothetical protein